MTEAIDILEGRAARYGGNLEDMLRLTPETLWDSPTELIQFWDQKDLSHIYPQSDYPHLANDWDNIVAEDSDVNRARGAEVMTEGEIQAAKLDAELDALDIEFTTFDDSLENLEELLEVVA